MTATAEYCLDSSGQCTGWFNWDHPILEQYRLGVASEFVDGAAIREAFVQCLQPVSAKGDVPAHGPFALAYVGRRDSDSG